MTESRTEVAVVGLGAMGAATLYQLARRGVRVIGLDRHVPPHAMGSHGGETRITRVAVGEGEAYVPFVQRSHAIWRELEAATGQTLLEQCGLLMMAPRGVRTGHHGKTDFLNRTAGIARRHAVPHQMLDASDIAGRFPAFLLHGDEEAYLEPGGGFVHPERCIAAQIGQAAALGATVLTGQTVHSLQPDGAGVLIVTDAGRIRAEQAVIAAGAWAGALLGPPFGGVLTPYRQVLHWFPVSDETPFRPDACPAYIWMHGTQPDDYFYGFPSMPGSGEAKVATEQYGAACDPVTVDRAVAPSEGAAMHGAHVGGRLRGAAKAPSRSLACLYTVTPDSGFVIGRHPGMDRVIVVSACSGHGFKHSAGIGEAVAQLACNGRSETDLQPFGIGRLQAGQPA